VDGMKASSGVVALSNAQIAELLTRAAETADGHRRRALQRAARAAFLWPEEAEAVISRGHSLTELPQVGPWIATTIESLLADPPKLIEPPEIRRGFLTLADARRTLAANPDALASLRSDLQMHTTYSDGRATLRDMVRAAAGRGYSHVAITDHSKGLAIANGMDETRLAEQARDIAAVNEELAASGQQFRVLHAIEMNLSPAGEGDMDPTALASLDLVLGAFHSNLRVTDDQTERYLAALRNPDVQVLAHPRGRRYNVRMGLPADWPRVMGAAANSGKALEIDAHLDRQDLDVELLGVAKEAGAFVSIGTDAHSVGELGSIELGLAAALRAGIARSRILNFMAPQELTAWVAHVRSG
jgi:histidinol phosphatase-like PHP family hydrolase